MIRTFDKELINSFLTQDDILPEFFKVAGEPKDYPEVYFLLGKVGLFPCVKKGSVMSCHAAIPKGVRGKDAYIDGRNVIKWVFEHTDCQTVATRAKKSRKHLLHYNAKLLNRVGEDDTYTYYEVQR